MSSLFVIRGSDQGARFELDEQPRSLGRDSSNAIQLRDTEVSRHHAEVRWADRGHIVRDLQSSNGTYVNGKRVQQHRLASGDQVQLGRTLMLYTGPAEEAADEALRNVAIGSPPADRSQIVHSVSQAEGSRLFRGEPGETTWVARARSNLEVMYHAALAASHTLDIDQLLTRIMELIFQWVEADGGCIMVMHPETKKLEPRVRRTRQGANAADKLTISRTILDYVLERNEGVLTSDARQDARWDAGASILQSGVREAICVPMQGRYDVVGVIYIDTSSSPEELLLKGGAPKFREDHLKLLIAIAHQAALAVEDTRYYSAMVQAERLAAIGQTVATLSHHIKNILQGIKGGSYLIEMGLNSHDESTVSKGWKIVERNQQRISTLVMDMLTFSKEREPDLRPGNINEVVADVVELSQLRATDLGVELVFNPAATMPTLTFDPEGMHRAVLNLVANAVDAACEVDRPGRVAITCEYLPKENKVRVTVEDNGGGVPADEADRLFSPFISTKKGRGTGLGLPVSQKIVHEHNGRILVHSTAGQGSRFTIEIPAVLAEGDPP